MPASDACMMITYVRTSGNYCSTKQGMPSFKEDEMNHVEKMSAMCA